MMVCLSMMAHAQGTGTAGYFTLCDDATSSSKQMTIKAILDLSNSAISWGYGGYGRYQVAAFVEGECHAFAMEGDSENMTYWNDRDQYYNWFVLELHYSSARRSKDISFHLYNNDTGMEYTLKTDDKYRTIGVNYGTDSNPIVLKAVEVNYNGIGFTDFEMRVNNMQDLSSKLTFSPSNATCPNNLDFNISPSTYDLRVTGNGGYQFTPSKVGSYDVSLSHSHVFFRNGTITVTRQPNYVANLSINSGYETLDVRKDDADMLGDMLAQALKVTYSMPSESPDEYPVWESGNTNIVGPDATGKLTPKKSGTCTLTAKVFNTPGDATSGTRKSASLTVKVHVYVDNINMLHSSLNCLVGDDLTDYLPRTYQLDPTDADNQTVTYTILRGDGILEKRSDGHIVAVGAGSASIQISSSDPGTPSNTLSVTVAKGYNDISIKQSSLSIQYDGAGNAQDITAAVKNNFSYLPDGGSFMGDYPTITSSAPTVVKIDQEQTATGVGQNFTATALGTGTATITVTLKVPNLIEMSLGNFSAEPTTVTKTFKVVMTQGAPSAISLPTTIQVKYGETLDLKTIISLTPANATLDYSTLEWSCTDDNWTEFFSITNNVLTTKKPSRNSFHLTVTAPSSVPGSSPLTATTMLTIPNPATGLSVKSGYETITVAMGESETLTQKLNDAFIVTPANHTDDFEYVIADETVITWERDIFYTQKTGTTTVTGRVYYYEGDVKKTRFEKSVTVIVEAASVPITDLYLERGIDCIYVNTGNSELLANMLEYALVYAPQNHTDKIEWQVADESIIGMSNGVLTPLKVGTTTMYAYVGDKSNPRLKTDDLTVVVGTQITAVKGRESVLHFKNDIFQANKKINQQLKDNLQLLPEGDPMDFNPQFSFSDNGVIVVDEHGVVDEDGLRPIYVGKAGTSTVTVTVTVPDYSVVTTAGKPGEKQLTGTFQIEVTEGLQGLTFDYVSTGVGETYELKLKTIPENAEFDFDASKFELSIDPLDSREFPSGWTFATWKPSGTDPLTFYLEGKCVGKAYLFVYYDGKLMAGGGATNMQVTPRYTVNNGWQWFALYDGVMKDLKAIKDVFGNKLEEVRTREAILVNDAEYGYLGDLSKLEGDNTYKLKLKDVPQNGYSFVIDAGEFGSIFSGTTKSLKKGWNWIGNPYQYYQKIDDVFRGTTFTNKDVICTGEGSATWNGTKWEGTLKYVTPGQGLLLYLHADTNVKLNAETDMQQNFDKPADVGTQTVSLPTVSEPADYTQRFQTSTVYYIDVQDGTGKSMVNDLDEKCIQAYIGHELRGVSTRWTTDANTGRKVFMVRVWGQEGDASQVSLSIYYGEKNNEVGYHLATLDFHGGVDETVGMPGKPLAEKFIPIDGIEIVPSVVSVKVGETNTVSAKMQPENHNELEPPHNENVIINHEVWFTSSDSKIFKVGLKDGVIEGVAVGQAQLDAQLIYVSEKNGELSFLVLYNTFTTVNVVEDDIPVTGIRNDMPSLNLERELGEDFQLSFTILPEYATNRKVTYEVGDENILSCTVDNKNVATFQGLGTGRTSITVTSEDNPEAKLIYQVTIVYSNLAGHVTNIKPKNEIIEALVGDIINSQLQYTVYPDYAVDKSVKFKVVNGNDGKVLDTGSNGDITAAKAGQSQVEIISNENPNVTATVTVNVYEPKEATSFLIPDVLTLSKFQDVLVSFTMIPDDATIDPSKLTVTITQSSNAGWGPAADVTAADKTGRNWEFSGKYVGEYTYSVKYNGTSVKTKNGKSTGKLIIPAEYPLKDGWQWKSLYAVPSEGALVLKDGNDWIGDLEATDLTRVYEIRTQNDFMHYDWTYGYFGTLTKLNPADGCFKIVVDCEDNMEDALSLNCGSSNLKMATSITLPQASKGYTWMTYPHELSHSVSALAPYLKKSASNGDVIMNSNTFIEYQDGTWLGSDDFTFEPGQGYIYYTEDETPKTIDWGPVTLAPEPSLARRHFTSRHALHSDCTLMVVHIKDDRLTDLSNYTVAAFIDGECRGIGRQTADGLFHLSVAGEGGETVTLCLMNKFTGQTLPAARSLSFGTKAGSHSVPLTIEPPTANGQWSMADGVLYDLQGRKIVNRESVNGKSMRGIYIVNGKKVIK